MASYYVDRTGLNIGRPYGCHVTGRTVATLDSHPIVVLQCDHAAPSPKGYRLIEPVKTQRVVIVRDRSGKSLVRIPVSKQNSLSKHGYRLGYIQDERRVALARAAKEYGPALVYRRLLALRNLREVPGYKGPSPPLRGTRLGDEWIRLSNDMQFIKTKYNPDLSRK